MYQSVVVPLDGSQFSERAVPFAVRLCADRGELVLVRSTLEPIPVTNASAARIAAARHESANAEAQTALAAIADKCRVGGMGVSWRVDGRDPATAILKGAEEAGAGIIVMTTHSRPAPIRAVLGSVAEEVVRRSKVPVLLVPPACKAQWPATGLRVLVALDGSPLAERGVAPAMELADSVRADVTLLHVLGSDGPFKAQTPEQYLQGLSTSLRSGGQVHIHVAAGTPSDRIMGAADEEPAHVIAMATHGRSGIASLLMGSVTRDVLTRANVPVLVIGPTATGLINE